MGRVCAHEVVALHVAFSRSVNDLLLMAGEQDNDEQSESIQRFLLIFLHYTRESSLTHVPVT